MLELYIPDEYVEMGKNIIDFLYLRKKITKLYLKNSIKFRLSENFTFIEVRK